MSEACNCCGAPIGEWDEDRICDRPRCQDWARNATALAKAWERKLERSAPRRTLFEWLKDWFAKAQEKS